MLPLPHSRKTLTAIAVLVCSMSTAGQSTQAVTAQDKTEIQALVSSYARALGSCAANDFADLFASNAGYFASGFRGHVVGRERLIAMVQSERHCIAAAGTAPAARPGPSTSLRPSPTVVVDVTPAGVFGIADLGGAGHYEDEYVKTPNGWRFAGRTVITPGEQAAGLNAREMTAIRRLASGPQDADDFWPAGQDGVKRFNSSGVVIRVAAGIVNGRVYLKDGGYYDDVYEKTTCSAGLQACQTQWRFKTRAYVAQ